MTAPLRRIAFLFCGALLAAPLHAADAPDEDASAVDRALPVIGPADAQAPLDESIFDVPPPPPPPIDLDYRAPPPASPEN